LENKVETKPKADGKKSDDKGKNDKKSKD